MNSEDVTNHMKQQPDVDENTQDNTSNTQPVKKKRRVRKMFGIIAGIFVGLGIIIFFLPAILGILYPDIEPFDDSDLTTFVIPKDYSPAVNSYYDLSKINDNVILKHDDITLLNQHLSGEKWDEEFVERVLSANQNSLNIYTNAAKKEIFYDDSFNADNVLVDIEFGVRLNSLKNLSKISNLKALSLAHQGSSTEALTEAIKSVKIGLQSRESFSPLIYHLFFVVLVDGGLETMRDVMALNPISTTTTHYYLDELEKYQELNIPPMQVRSSLKSEYTFFAAAIDDMANSIKTGVSYLDGKEKKVSVNSSVGIKYYFQPNRTKKLFADYLREYFLLLDTECNPSAQINLEHCGVFNLDSLRGKRFNDDVYFNRNIMGEALFISLISSLNSFSDKVYCKKTANISATQLTLALKGYHQEHGELPATLDELIPEYFLEIPTDPYSGERLKYSPSPKIIYSVGGDREDNGGDVEKDIVYDIAF